MTQVIVNVDDLVQKLSNIVMYTEGFAETAQARQLAFNQQLADHVVDLLGKYIDSQARLSPEHLHHVYEWGQVGSADARLFEFNTHVSSSGIQITGSFRPSTSLPPGGTEPFVDKAAVMESGISITIKPKNSDVLAFEVGDETVFTSTEVFVEHPGGPDVEGAFGDTVHEFLNGYMTVEVIAPILNRMSKLAPYKQGLKSAAQGGGYSSGVKAANNWVKVEGTIDEIS